MKNCFLISCDLKKKRDYGSLQKAIESYGAHAKILNSSWAIFTAKPASEIRNHLLKFMDPADGLFIASLGKEAAWWNVECEGDWLKNNLS